MGPQTARELIEHFWLDWLDSIDHRRDMKNVWQLQEAKNQFSLVVDNALSHGPQTVTRHGEPAVMVVSVADFKKRQPKKKTILELFKPIQGAELELSRDPSLPRDVSL